MTSARTMIQPVGTADSRSGDTPQGGRRNLLLAILIISLLIPIQPALGGTRLDPFRIVLLAMIVPLSIQIMSGKAGRFTLADGMMFAFGIWVIVTLVFHHGFARFPYAVIAATELLGGYVAGRMLIRSGADYRTFVRYFVIALLVLFPFALTEVLTGRVPLSEFLGKAFPVIVKNYEFRHGFFRTQAVFPHPIHFGVFCAVGVANVYFVYRDRFMAMLPRLGLVSIMAMMSVSSAAVISVAMQLMMIAYGKITGSRWMLLLSVVTFLYVFLSFASNRGPMIIFIETFALEPQTAWWRVYIWQYGSQNVWDHPFLGIGLNDWQRPEWLAPTIDNFWLVLAIRHGLPGVLLLVGAVIYTVWHTVRVKEMSPDNVRLRTGHVIALVALLFALTTVHAWDALAVFVMFYIGAGSVFHTGQVSMMSSLPEAANSPEEGGRRPVTYTRKPDAASARGSMRYTRFAGNDGEDPKPPGPRIRR